MATTEGMVAKPERTWVLGLSNTHRCHNHSD